MSVLLVRLDYVNHNILSYLIVTYSLNVVDIGGGGGQGLDRDTVQLRDTPAVCSGDANGFDNEANNLQRESSGGSEELAPYG